MGGRLYESYSDGSMSATCFVYNYDEIDTDTDTDHYLSTHSPQKRADDSNGLSLQSNKGKCVMSIAGIMVFLSFCSVCCLMKKYRKKQRNHVAEIDENLLGESELNEEGIQREYVEEEAEIVIPGQIEIDEIDQAIVDEIVNQYVKDENNEDDDDVEISEGNEGVEDEQHSSTEESLSNL